jgi:hypothetical protein
MRRYILFSVLLFTVLLWAPDLAAQTPRTISFQGVLVDAAGNAVPDGDHQIRIAMYSGPSGGSALFTEQHTTALKEGVFSIVIGSVTPIPPALEFDKQYYLGIAVDNGAEMSPRTAFTAVPYAMHAVQAETAQMAESLAPGAEGVVGSVNGLDGDITLQGAGGTTITKSGSTITITSSGGSVSGIAGVQNVDGSLAVENPNGPVATLGVADNGIGHAKLRADAVGTPNLQDGAVATGKIADLAVTNVKIFDSAVTEAKLDDASVGTTKIRDLAVSGAKIQDGAVSSGKLQDGAVTFPKIENGAVGTVKIEDQAITTDKLKDYAVTRDKIQDATVTLEKINTIGAQNGQAPVFNNGILDWADLSAGGSGFSMPYADTIDINKPALFVRNLGGDGLSAHAIEGRNALRGIVAGSNGGYSFYLDAGVAGYAKDGRGIGGTSTNGSGVEGSSETGSAGKFTITNPSSISPALSASTLGSGQGMVGRHMAATGVNPGVEGVTQSAEDFASGVIGRSSATTAGRTFGVYGINHSTNEFGAGVIGTHNGAGAGVEGTSSGGVGVYGHGFGYAGVKGNSENGPGMLAGSVNGYGVEASSANSIGVYAAATHLPGVKGSSQSGPGVEGTSVSGPAVKGTANAGNVGILGVSTISQSAIRGDNTGSGSGVTATSNSGAALWAQSSNGVAMHAFSGTDNIIEAYGAGGLIGNLRFRVLQDGNVRCDGAFTGGGADLAEAFDVEGSREEYEPGDVLVISAASDRRMTKSTTPNSGSVAGVYATKPGVLLAPHGAEDDIDHLVPMGIVGVIPTKVCGENGPIRRGDLLVTSSLPGHAMKAVPAMVGGVAVYPTGAVLGKALQNFDGNGSGMIEVLVNVK